MAIHGFVDQNGAVQKYDYASLENVPTDLVKDADLDVVIAVQNEIKEDVDELKDNVGDLSELETENKTNLVVAINEASASGLSSDFKLAILQFAEKVAYIDENGQTYYNDLYNALYAITRIRLSSNSLSFMSLNSTKQLSAVTVPEGGAITWSSSNPSIATVSSDGLVTSIAYGSAIITASAGRVSAECSVLIATADVTSISVVYTPSRMVYDNTSLDDLKSDLVVTASWSNGETSTVEGSDYALSGVLEQGTSTITVNYGGKTATFDVEVTEAPIIYDLGELVNSSYVDGNNGSDKSAAGWARTDYIDVQDGEVIGIPTSDDSSYRFFYTETNTPCGRMLAGFDVYTEGDRTYVYVPFNAKYFRLSGTNAHMEDMVQKGVHGIIISGTIPDGEPYTFMRSTGGVYYDTSKKAPVGTSNYAMIYSAPCNGVKTISFAPLANDHNNLNAFLDENKTFISSFTLSASRTEVAVPENAYYFVVSSLATYMDTFLSGDTYPVAEE